MACRFYDIMSVAAIVLAQIAITRKNMETQLKWYNEMNWNLAAIAVVFYLYEPGQVEKHISIEDTYEYVQKVRTSLHVLAFCELTHGAIRDMKDEHCGGFANCEKFENSAFWNEIRWKSRSCCDMIGILDAYMRISFVKNWWRRIFVTESFILTNDINWWWKLIVGQLLRLNGICIIMKWMGRFLYRSKWYFRPWRGSEKTTTLW